MESALQVATQLAYQVGDLLLEHFNHSDRAVRLKPDQSLVTEADLAADRLISSTLHAFTPEEVILSEELASVYPANTAQAVWIIDPLDGTTNFSLGLQHWGISLARVMDGIPHLAVIFFPLLAELYTAQRGQGAYLNQKPIHVRPPDPQDPAPFFYCCSRKYREYQVRVPYKARILGSATYSFCMVARGLAVLSFEARPKIWDIAAAGLVVEEAGGMVETYQGDAIFPLIPGTDYSQQSYPSLAAASSAVIRKARSWIQPNTVVARHANGLQSN